MIRQRHLMMSSELATKQRQKAFEDISQSALITEDVGSFPNKVVTWASGLLLVYFGIRLIFFALNISAYVPPDEVTHVGLCKTFSKFLLFPDNSPATYEFGLVTNIPWLYYWIMGKLLHLNIFGISSLVFLRLLNIPIAFATVFFVRRTLLLLTDDRLVQFLLVAAMTNTAMFSLLSASVSSDNLTNLLAAMSIYYFLAFLACRSGSILAGAILCQLLGSLTKVTFLPLVLVLNVLLFIHEFRRLPTLPAAIKEYFLTSNIKHQALTLMIFIALGLNLHLYAGNYLQFGTLTPSMSDVFPVNIASQYRIAARETIFREYSRGLISYMDALVMTGDIKHPGDKADTFYLLMNYENLKRNPQLWMGPLPYTKIWFENMVGTILGIKGHLPMFKDFQYIIPAYLVVALSLLGFTVRWRLQESGWLPFYLTIIVCCYAGFLLYKVNYSAYQYYGAPGITLQGRYLFPVISPLYILMCHYMLQLFRTNCIRIALAVATAFLFISYDFPWFLMHANPEWYDWMPK